MISGVLYCIYNRCYDYYGDNVYKLGFAKDLKKRLKGYITSYIDKPEIIYSINVDDCVKCEKKLFSRLKEYRINDNREFFKCDKKHIIDMMKEVALVDNVNDKTIKLNLVNVPEISENEYNKLLINNYNTNYNNLQCKKYDLLTKIKMLNPEEKINISYWSDREYILDNILYACGKSMINNNDKYLNNIRKKINYLNQILEIYGFKNMFDFNSVLIKDENIEERMINSRLLEWNDYQKVMKCFNKKSRRTINKFSFDSFIKLSNVILNDFALRLKSVKRRKRDGTKLYYEYKYRLLETRVNIFRSIDK